MGPIFLLPSATCSIYEYIFSVVSEISFEFLEDVLTDDKGECVICLEELCEGNIIARLPCLCIYHKT